MREIELSNKKLTHVPRLVFLDFFQKLDHLLAESTAVVESKKIHNITHKKEIIHIASKTSYVKREMRVSSEEQLLDNY